ncbi:MAG: GSCFA domain-containing protein [Litoreibacter sp.]
MEPYKDLPTSAFWKPAVAEADEVSQLWFPKFEIQRNDPISTAGSCFAQNIGRSLRNNNMNWLVTEKPPKTLPRSLHAAHGYGLFSFRTGNIYSPVLLHQWVKWAFDPSSISTEVWQGADRFFDPFRPSVRPNGFDSLEEVIISRQATARAVRDAVLQSKVLIYTPGLTETWINTQSKEIYPACPGTVCGNFDPAVHRCVNVGFQAGKDALTRAFTLMRAHNKDIKLLLTVSPVPITATVTGTHVLSASTYTKSVLRALVGEFTSTTPGTDYFPSYDLVSAAMLDEKYFDTNRRTITPQGVEKVMHKFFEGLGHTGSVASTGQGDIVCEDEILEYYGKS